MRTQTEEEKATAIALAIYRGLPDCDRAERIKLARQHRKSTDVQLRTFAANILPLLEKAEAEIQAERRRTDEIVRRLAYLEQSRTFSQPDGDPYANVRADQSRALFGVGLVAAGIAGATYLFTTLGPGIVFGSVVAVLLLRLMFGGSGSQQGDYAATAGQAQSAGHTVTVNVNVGNGTGTATTQAG